MKTSRLLWLLTLGMASPVLFAQTVSHSVTITAGGSIPAITGTMPVTNPGAPAPPATSPPAPETDPDQTLAWPRQSWLMLPKQLAVRYAAVPVQSLSSALSGMASSSLLGLDDNLGLAYVYNYSTVGYWQPSLTMLAQYGVGNNFQSGLSEFGWWFGTNYSDLLGETNPPPVDWLTPGGLLAGDTNQVQAAEYSPGGGTQLVPPLVAGNWSEAVGGNRLGHLIVREIDSVSGSNGATSTSGFMLSARLWTGSVGTSTTLLGQALVVDLTTNGATTTSGSGQTLDARFLNDQDMVAGYRVDTADLGWKYNGPIVDAKTGVLDSAGLWNFLGYNLALSGLTSAVTTTTTTGVTLTLSPPTAYGFAAESSGPELWWAGPTATGWDLADFQVWLPGIGNGPGALISPDLAAGTNWRMNDQLEMILGDHRLIRNGTLYFLEDLLPAGWLVSSTQTINSSGVILAQAAPTQDANGNTFLITQPSVPVLLVPATLAVDANRDGVIDAKDYAAVSNTAPFRFWVNDDDASGDTGGTDIPQANGGNGATNGVGGRRDLVNYFPVFLDIKQLLVLLPPAEGYIYKLKQADGSLRFMYSNLGSDQVLNYQRPPPTSGPLTAGFSDTAISFVGAPENVPTTQITAAGVQVSYPFLQLILNNNNCGMILVEGCAPTTAPLVLSVENSSGTVLAKTSLPLCISEIENMYRHLNLRSGPDAPPDSSLAGIISVRNGDPGNASNYSSQPSNLPDTNPGQPWFVFVDGSNVGGQSSRGWEAETFKRLYWSGSNARFLGVSWFGDPYSSSTELVYDYHMAVRNAFATATILAQKINALPGSGPKTISGHSAACVLIASAIADQGLSVNHVCFIDAAMAQECFDGASANNLTAMVPPSSPVAWQSYPPAYWASNWAQGFPSADARSLLSWSGRFASIAGQITNFYSSTEDALAEYDGDVPSNVFSALVNAADLWSAKSFVWVYQEKAKGNRQDYYVYPSHVGSTYAGWGFNRKDPYTNGDPLFWNYDSSFNVRVPDTAAAIGTVSSTVLDRQPVFEPGFGSNVEWVTSLPSWPADTSPSTGSPTWIFGLYGTSGSAIAADPVKRAQLLAEAIPALSLPVGSRSVGAFHSSGQPDRNHNLPAEFVNPAYWPASRGTNVVNGTPIWWHSDMREVAYVYLYNFYDNLVSISNQ